MKEVRVGYLIFSSKAILLIALLMFIIGVVVGAYVVLRHEVNAVFFFVSLYIPHLYLIKHIKKNIKEIK